jgi:hypothetical protein
LGFSAASERGRRVACRRVNDLLFGKASRHTDGEQK